MKISTVIGILLSGIYLIKIHYHIAMARYEARQKWKRILREENNGKKMRKL